MSNFPILKNYKWNEDCGAGRYDHKVALKAFQISSK
jgi:hypothetical protein